VAESHENRVETKPADHACCQFKAVAGGDVPTDGTTNGSGDHGPDSVGGPATGPEQLI
jgi:hypothetical protein